MAEKWVGRWHFICDEIPTFRQNKLHTAQSSFPIYQTQSLCRTHTHVIELRVCAHCATFRVTAHSHSKPLRLLFHNVVCTCSYNLYVTSLCLTFCSVYWCAECVKWRRQQPRCRLLENKLRSNRRKKIGAKTFHHFNILRIHIRERCSAIHRTLPPLPHWTWLFAGVFEYDISTCRFPFHGDCKCLAYGVCVESDDSVTVCSLAHALHSCVSV